MSDDLLFLNGIDATTGSYLTPELTVEQLARVVRGIQIDPNDPHFQDLQGRKSQTDLGNHLGVASGIDANNLASAGWAVIFPHNIDPAIKDALKPLLEHRRRQAAEEKEHFYQEYSFAPNDTKQTFMRRYKAAPGPADPEKMPYYLLIVGSPQQVPYRFQYQMDVQYAVGRLHLDTPADYARYAQSVVDVETGKAAQLPRRATFFGVRNNDDRATQLSADQLIGPMVTKLKAEQAGPKWQGRGRPQWEMSTLLGEGEATKARLARLLGGPETPALLFTASHGAGFPNAHPRQLSHQGALVCQDWPGPLEWREALKEDHYFAFSDLGDDARLLGMIAFLFACYGAGTPQWDEFNHRAFSQPRPIAPHDFTARLPQRMLGHPNGGALAVVGHVERAWGYSFMWEGVGAHFVAFESMLADLLREGFTVGAALEYFNERYAELSAWLSDELDQIQFHNKTPNELALVGMWTANNDSRNYVILGDPAVRLPVGASTDLSTERPTIGEVTLASSNGAARPAEPVITEGAAEPGTTTVTVAASATVGPDSVAVDFSLFGGGGSLQRLQEGLFTSLQQFTTTLGTALQRAVADVTSLEVRTYVSDQMEGLEYKDGKFTGDARLVAFTRISLDQDTRNVVPRRDGVLDESLWAIHTETVRLAQAQRAEMLKAAVEAVTGLLGSLQRPG